MIVAAGIRSGDVMRSIVAWVLVALLLWWASTFAYQVNETEVAIVTQFGRPVSTVLTAGLRFKWPEPIQSVLRFDRRLQMFETPTASRPNDEFLTQDKKNVVVSTYTVWRIPNDEHAVMRFLQTVRDSNRAEERLADLVLAELGAMLGAHPFAELISDKAESWKWPQHVHAVTDRCQARARADFGIEIVDFQIQRIAFPEQNRRSVFERMRAERERIASQYRAEGQEEAAKIRAAARGEEVRILAEADEHARRIRGEADAEATRIFGEAHSQDPEFFEYLRSLESYAKSFDENTVLVLSPESRFLRWLQGASAPAAPTTRPDAQRR